MTGKDFNEVEKSILRTIALEEHFATTGFLDGPGRKLKHQAVKMGGQAAQLLDRLCDLGEKRIAAMDAAGIDVQVLSLTSPGIEQLQAAESINVARESNAFLASAVEKYPTRFAAFAALPTGMPQEAAKELERMVREHQFKGAIINGHHRGRYLDDKYFWPIFECAASLAVPIYLHPTYPPNAVVEASYGGFAPLVSELLAGAGWGWHIETAVHALRLILGGVFDRYPGLQIVLGHMGETLPFMIRRLDEMPTALTALKHPISRYLRENFHYTFSGFNFTPTFLLLLLEVGIGRIMFSTDYPYSSMAQARSFLDELPIAPREKALIAHENAERLFHV
jgi:uncharacterized protein